MRQDDAIAHEQYLEAKATEDAVASPQATVAACFTCKACRKRVAAINKYGKCRPCNVAYLKKLLGSRVKSSREFQPTMKKSRKSYGSWYK